MTDPNRSGRVFGLAVISLIAACAAAAPSGGSGPDAAAGPPGALSSFTLVPGVLAEPEAGTVYLMRPGGGIESLDVDSGSRRWTSEHADRPLFIAGGILVAQHQSDGPGLSLALLDPATGEPAPGLGTPLLLALPRGVRAGIDQTLERSFTLSVLQSRGEIYLSWEFIERDVTGVSPPAGRPFAKLKHGAYRFSGDGFEEVAPESIAADPPNWPAELERLVASRQVARSPWRAGSVLAVVRQRYAPDQLLLKRWRHSDGKPLPERLLYAGRAVAVLASCNQRHIVVATPSGVAPPAAPYLLRYHALDSGDLVAEVPSLRSAGPFCFLGSRLLWLSPPALRREGDALIDSPLELVGAEAGSGTEIWRRPLRDTAFRGPAPPRT